MHANYPALLLPVWAYIPDTLRIRKHNEMRSNGYYLPSPGLQVTGTLWNNALLISYHRMLKSARSMLFKNSDANHKKQMYAPPQQKKIRIMMDLTSTVKNTLNEQADEKFEF